MRRERHPQSNALSQQVRERSRDTLMDTPSHFCIAYKLQLFHFREHDA